jgi:hypothetical protein
LKTQPKQVFGYLPLAFVLPAQSNKYSACINGKLEICIFFLLTHAECKVAGKSFIRISKPMQWMLEGPSVVFACKVHFSALFTFLVVWHASALSLPSWWHHFGLVSQGLFSSGITSLLACKVTVVHVCSTQGSFLSFVYIFGCVACQCC